METSNLKDLLNFGRPFKLRFYEDGLQSPTVEHQRCFDIQNRALQIARKNSKLAVFCKGFWLIMEIVTGHSVYV